MKRYFVAALYAIVVLPGLCAAAADVIATTAPTNQGTYVATTAAGVQIQTSPSTTETYAVAPVAKPTFANAHAGDIVTVTFGDPKQPAQVTAVDLRRPVADIPILIALCLSFLVLLALAAWVTGWKPQRFIIGLDNRFSNSQTQIVLWFGAVMTAYLALLALRIIYIGWGFVGGISLPQNLIVLSGFSAFSFGAARVIRQSKDGPGGAAVVDPGVTPKLTDFVQNDAGAADIGDFQMLLIAVIAVVIFLMMTFHAFGQLAVITPTSLPDVDTTLLSVFGIGQGAYLVKKAGSAPGQG